MLGTLERFSFALLSSWQAFLSWFKLVSSPDFLQPLRVLELQNAGTSFNEILGLTAQAENYTVVSLALSASTRIDTLFYHSLESWLIG